ncbi:uncharacterized protein LOC114540535 [Dendronephthya gigantea]|uniref:uncharacterized protein LOC114540535 n=1 Tax=Dendronephthya gigantea TaxID=151771 RepID=UPI00106A0279|nr:uncharacterized protein LOC114540535 [Dendronephthya gigantea]
MANLWLFIFISCILLKGTDSEREVVICYNSTLEDSWLKGSVVKRMFVLGKMIDCLVKCVTEPCCRSINYKKHSKDNETNCEMLHSVVDEITSQEVLEKNASYDHIYLINTTTINNKSCLQDTDECALEKPKCHSNATCINTNGSYECHCRSGFTGNGTTCSDIDECSLGTYECHSNATCNNTIGSYECHCRRGFAGNGTTCSVHEFDSDILSGEAPEFTKLLGDWLPQTGNWSVCWRATSDDMKSYNVVEFHNRCDPKVPTLTVVKVDKNEKPLVFGGFANSEWTVAKGRSGPAPGSFLFSFRNNDDLAPFKSPLKNSSDKNAIQRNKKSAVKFGTGPDFSIADETNSQKTYECYANLGFTYQPPSGYFFGESKTQSLLAGSLVFTPAKVEVLYLN